MTNRHGSIENRAVTERILRLVFYVPRRGKFNVIDFSGQKIFYGSMFLRNAV
jgi:hypothetical protein